MNLGQLRVRFRQRADDQAAPYLWDDAEIDAYANEAVAEAAERAWLLYDALEPTVTRIQLRPGRAAYRLHDSILWLDRVVNAVSGDVLTPVDIASLDRHGDWQDHRGTPRLYITQGHTLRLYPCPAVRLRLRLGVYRLPIERMHNDRDCPEIETRWHERLLDWILHRAYAKRDVDAEDIRRSDRHLGAFIESFGHRDDADTQRKQAERARPVAAINGAWAATPRDYVNRYGRHSYDDARDYGRRR